MMRVKGGGVADHGGVRAGAHSRLTHPTSLGALHEDFEDGLSPVDGCAHGATERRQ